MLSEMLMRCNATKAVLRLTLLALVCASIYMLAHILSPRFGGVVVCHLRPSSYASSSSSSSLSFGMVQGEDDDDDDEEEEQYPLIDPWPENWLRINRSRVVVAGHSNAADFAHQVHIAYSSLVNGACIFAGQPFHCAVQRFEEDPLVEAGSFERESYNVPNCPDCPRGKALVYDHCKNMPHVIDVGMLPDYPRRICGPDGKPGCLDGVDNLRKPNQRVYLQRGTMDKCYRKGSVAAVEGLYAQLLDHPSKQILFNNTIPLHHTIPHEGNEVAPSYDGPRECFKHTFFEDADDDDLQPKAGIFEDHKYRFTQHRFGGFDPLVGTNKFGWLYVPSACINKSETCGLFVYFRPCGGGSGVNDANLDEFDTWAENNRIVILNPVVGKNKCFLKYRGCTEVARGCWDGYGQLGSDYALQSGKHMMFAGNILKGFLDAYGV